jgi:hypothetical protein
MWAARVHRVEGARLLTGAGTYVDDIAPGKNAARVLRPQRLRPGRDRSIDTPPRSPSPASTSSSPPQT